MKKQITYLFSLLFFIPMVAMAANAPPRHNVEEKVMINADPAAVWDMVKNFDSLHVWHPAVVSSEATGGNGAGATRVLTLGENITIKEELKAFKEDEMTFKYSIIEMSTVGTVDDEGETLNIPVVPVNKYISFVTVKPVDGGSEVIWKGKFFRAYTGHHDVPEAIGDEAAVNAVTGIYRAGLDNLKTMMEK